MDTKTIIRSKSTQALVRVLQSLAGNELSRMQTERTLRSNEKQLESQKALVTAMEGLLKNNVYLVLKAIHNKKILCLKK